MRKTEEHRAIAVHRDVGYDLSAEPEWRVEGIATSKRGVKKVIEQTQESKVRTFVDYPPWKKWTWDINGIRSTYITVDLENDERHEFMLESYLIQR